MTERGSGGSFDIGHLRSVIHLPFVIWILAFLFCSAGCARNSILPAHDEVLTFNLPYDLAFLRTMEAVEAHPDWDLDMTLKEQGIIKIRNLRYSSFADADQRGATLLLKRIGPRQTSVQFDKESWGVVGGDEILKLINQYLSLEAG